MNDKKKEERTRLIVTALYILFVIVLFAEGGWMVTNATAIVPLISMAGLLKLLFVAVSMILVWVVFFFGPIILFAFWLFG